MTRSPPSSGSRGSRRVRVETWGSGEELRRPAILPPISRRDRSPAGAVGPTAAGPDGHRDRWRGSGPPPRRPRQRDRCRHGHAPHGHRGRRAGGVRRAPEGAGRRGHNLANRAAAEVRRARPRRIDRCLRIPRGRIVAPRRRARRAREAPPSPGPARVRPEAQAGGVGAGPTRKRAGATLDPIGGRSGPARPGGRGYGRGRPDVGHRRIEQRGSDAGQGLGTGSAPHRRTPHRHTRCPCHPRHRVIAEPRRRPEGRRRSQPQATGENDRQAGQRGSSREGVPADS